MGGHGPRERVVYGCAQLVRERGVTGTGLREVVARAGAPRGSLQHYFPGGKDQIVREALGWSAEFAAARVRDYMDGTAGPTPGGLFGAMVEQWRVDLRRRGFVAGCPLVAATADVAASNEALRAAIRAGFETWVGSVRAALDRMGVPAGRAAGLALLMISALEGAIVLARSRHELAPLDAVEAELRPLLDGAAR